MSSPLTEIIDSIGTRLREERERLGKSQTDFANIAARAGVRGATRQSQALYEKGERSPDAGYLAAIRTIGVDVEYVLSGKTTLYASEPIPTTLTTREADLLDNYRHASEAGQKALVQTSAALAQSKDVKKSA